MQIRSGHLSTIPASVLWITFGGDHLLRLLSAFALAFLRCIPMWTRTYAVCWIDYQPVAGETSPLLERHFGYRRPAGVSPNPYREIFPSLVRGRRRTETTRNCYVGAKKDPPQPILGGSQAGQPVGSLLLALCRS